MAKRKYTINQVNPGWFKEGEGGNTPETNQRKSTMYLGEGNPYFGKKHSKKIRAKMQRPRGVISLGISVEEYRAKLESGQRWCVGHQAFLAGELFSLRGFRNGVHRKSAHCKTCVRKTWLWKAYKVTPEWYDAKLQEQGGHCALCPVTEKEEGRPLAVDHDHNTGKVRGILCRRCNRALERLDTVPGFSDRVIAFLKR